RSWAGCRDGFARRRGNSIRIHNRGHDRRAGASLSAASSTEADLMVLTATVIFWVSALALFYVYVGYPVLLSLIAPFKKRRNLEPGFTPSISVLIAACNEEASIREKLVQTLKLEYPRDKIEILVLSDGSQDRTDEIVRQFPDPC